MNRKLIVTLIVTFLFAFSSIVVAQELTKEEKRARKKEARKLLKLSVDLIKDSKLDSAQIILDSLIIFDPKNPDAYYKKGWLLTQKNDTAQALTIVSKGVEKAPLSSRLKIFLARLKINTGDIDGAIPLLDYVLSIKPNEGEALYLKGLTLLEKNNTAEAVEAFNRALDIAIKKGK